MMFILLIFLLINNSHSLEWNCMKNKHFLISNEQCTIIVEYISLNNNNNERQICLTHTLSIKSLPSLSFYSNYSMKILQINFCQLLTLNQLPFILPSSIEKLDLSYNLLSKFTLNFLLLSNLKYLYLDYNPNLIDINLIDHNHIVQENLINLSLQHNKQIQILSLPKSLIQLDLTNCNILPSSILLKSLINLTHLSLGQNQLKHLPIFNENIQFEYLNLSKNSLTFIDNKLLNKNLKILDLSYNQIKSLEFFKEFLKFNQTQILQLSLYDNPLICDCWFSSIMNSPFINITDLEFLQCHSHTNYLCSYSRHCSFNCTCCDFEACDCHSICPSECLCSHNTFWSYHLIKCQEKNLSNIHIVLPETITELNYENNSIEEIKSFIFIGKIFLNKINLANNNLLNITNETFCGALNLKEINLSYNLKLRNIISNRNYLFKCLKNLQYIILSKEQINNEEEEEIDSEWIIEYEQELVRLIRITSSSSIEPSTIFSIYHQESYTFSNIIQHNQTLILIIFFLLLFLLLFSLLLISLVICRRKLRHHLTTEFQHQQSQHYYHHHHRRDLHPSLIKIPESNGTSATNESVYEQLPSLSSDSEQPFLYNDKKYKSINAPALPPYPPTFRQYHCYHPHDNQYTINRDYSQYQCPTVLVVGNCTNNNESMFVPTKLCRCADTYIYPHVQR